MDLLLVILATVTSAFSCGTVVADWRQRAKALRDLYTARNDLLKTTAEIAATHNQLAQQILAMQEQINSHEFKIAGQQAKGPSPWTAASMTRSGIG